MDYTNFVNINLDNLNENISYIKNTYNYKYYMVDVSNNAFNHGMYIVNYLIDKIDFLYTNAFNDCILIRKYNKNIPIIYSGIINADNIFDLIINNVIILIKNKETLVNILNLNIKDKINVILNIDLYNYNGIDSKYEVCNILELIKNSSYVDILGVKAKIIEDDYDDFRYVVSPLKNLQLIILNDEDDKNKIKLSNAIKLDCSIYGINNIKKSLFKKENMYLKQIFTLNSKIVKIIKNNKNKKDILIGIIPFGYLNGMLDRIHKVSINNKLYDIKEIKDEYSLVEIDDSVNINDIVQIVSSHNPLENYYQTNTLLYFSLLNNNLPIIYNNYTLEKTFIY